MVRSEFRYWVHLLRLVILLMGLGALIFAGLFFKVLFTDFDHIGLIAVLMFSLLSMVFLLVGFDSFKAVSIDSADRSILISYFGIYKQEIPEESIIGYVLEPVINRAGTFKGILIQFNSGKQLHFSELDFRNYAELEKVLKAFLPLDKNIKLNYFTPFTKVIYWYAGLFILLMISVKLFEIK